MTTHNTLAQCRGKGLVLRGRGLVLRGRGFLSHFHKGLSSREVIGGGGVGNGREGRGQGCGGGWEGGSGGMDSNHFGRGRAGI